MNRTPVRRRRRWSAAAVSTGVAAATLLVAVGAWLLPDPLDVGAEPGPTNRTETASSPSPTATTSPVPSAPRYLDTLTPVSGASRLTRLPRELDGQPEYGRSVVIKCPSNQSDDKVSEVTYQLSGDYLDLTARVRAHAVDTEDLDAPVWVTPVLVKIQRDGLPASKDGPRVITTSRGSAELRAVLDDQDQLKIRIQCRSPRVMVILVGGALTRAGR